LEIVTEDRRNYLIDKNCLVVDVYAQLQMSFIVSLSGNSNKNKSQLLRSLAVVIK